MNETLIHVSNLKPSETLLSIVYYDSDKDALTFKFANGADKEELWAMLQKFLRIPESMVSE